MTIEGSHSVRPEVGDDPTATISSATADAGLVALGWGLVALAVALAANSILGPLLADTIDYPVSDTMRNQTIGLDAASLFVVAPITAAVGILALRGHPAAPTLALGPAGCVAYLFVQYVAGPDHLNYPPVLVLQLGLFIGGWLLAGVAWRIERRRSGRRPVREHDLAAPHGWVAFGLGAFVFARYLPGLVGSITNEPLPAASATDPAMYWLIVLLDLGIYLPATIMAGVGLRRGLGWAALLHRGLVVWFLLITIAVGTMAAAMLINDDPNASAGQLILFITVGTIIIGYAVAILRPTLRDVVSREVCESATASRRPCSAREP
ncbi:MAG: hypothetical protein AAF531_26760, partial [Actinomycetota bacterium]